VKALSLPAHAKINLYLHVGRRRRDGFHSLDTEFQEISLGDRLKFQVTEAPVIRLSVKGARLPVDSSNLVIRALAKLRLKLGVKQGMSAQLIKNIPIGAGLGGGSSDAAAALWAGWLLWKKKSPRLYRRKIPAVLNQIAPTLGADVSFFLRGGRARGQGKGELLTPLQPGHKRWMVLVHPQAGVSTKDAYGWLDGDRRNSRLPNQDNDFEFSVFKRRPVVRRIKNKLSELGCRGAMMSGSGSAVFGFVSSKKQGQRIQGALKKYRWDSWIVHT
jgi:4-diphosphocytidyl-2-C-methyl-D-erythritol kinase